MKANRLRISVLIVGILACFAAATTGYALAAPSPDVYDFKSLFSYTDAAGEWGGNEGIIANNAYWGENSFKIVSDKTGAEANGSGARMNAVFSDYAEFTLNPIPKAGAATANDYAFRVLKVRIADALDETDYFDFVAHNVHSWVAAPSVFPNTDGTEQGALSFVEYNGVKTGDTTGTEVPDWSFGGPMLGGFCGSTRLTTNMTFRFDRADKKLTVQDGSAGGFSYTVNADAFGKAFGAELFTVSFIFDRVEEGERAGIAIANIKSQYGADMWTNTEGSKTAGSLPVVRNRPDLGDLGAFGENSPGKETEITVDLTGRMTAIDFETGYYDLPLGDENVALGYRKAGETGVTPVTAVPFAVPARFGDYELAAAVRDRGGDLSEYAVIGTFSVPSGLEIKLIGDAEITVEVNNPIDDPGATVLSTDLPPPSYTSDFDRVNFEVVGDYTVTYTVTDSTGNTASVTRLIKVADTTPPALAVEGEDTVIIDVGSAFTPPAASATDNYDASVTVTTVGAVDANTVGNYKLTYSATDASGNTATAVRTIIVARPVSAERYDFGSLIACKEASGAWGSNEGAIAGDEFGRTGYNIVSDKSGAAANGSGFKLKGVFGDNVEFALNPIAKPGAVSAEDYAFRVLKVRFADALNPEDYFDYVIHNKHAWLPAPSVFPNTDLRVQGALSYIEYNGVRKSNGDPENSSGMPVSGLPFGGAMAGGFCSSARLDANMRFQYDFAANKITYADGSGQGKDLLAIDEATFGKTFEAEYFTVEFIFDEIQPGQRAGVSIAELTSGYETVLTEDRGSKTDGTPPRVISGEILGSLGKFRTGDSVEIDGTARLLAYDFEAGLYDLGLADERLSYFYRPAGETGAYTEMTDRRAAAPETEGGYEVFAEVTDVGGNKSGKHKIGSFTVSNAVAPITVTVVGDYEVTVEVGGAWTDPGATAVDENGKSYEVTSDFHLVDFNKVDDYVVTYSAVDINNGNTVVTAVRVVKVVDTTAPTLTLKGEAELTLALGDAFTDAGYTVSDNYDENVGVTVAGSVNTAAMGEYVLTYTATDGSGNTAEVTRTVRVTDNVKPTVSVSGHATSGKAGSDITFGSITVTDNSGETPSYLVKVTGPDGVPADIDRDNNSFRPTGAGTYIVTVTATDSSGNTGEFTYTVEVGKKGGCGCGDAGASVLLIVPVAGALFIRRRRTI